jgi:hypothetical protein
MKRLTQYVLLAALAASVLGIVLAAQPRARRSALRSVRQGALYRSSVFHYNRRSCR